VVTKLIKEFVPSILWVGLFVLLVVTMGKHFRDINTPNDPMDKEAVMLKEIKKSLPEGAQASFTTNLHDDEASQGAYYQTEFAWCPGALSDDVSLNDNIILYRSSAVKDSSIVVLLNCDTLYRGSGDDYTLMFLHKRKKAS
jgi:hypothetical protein